MVPVIIVSRNQALPPIKCKPKSNFITKKNGNIEINLMFNRRVHSLEVMNNSVVGTCIDKKDNSWNVIFDGISEKILSLSIIANGNLLPEKVNIKVKDRGIKKNTDMGGLP